jgi:hypothetical protein
LLHVPLPVPVTVSPVLRVIVQFPYAVTLPDKVVLPPRQTDVLALVIETKDPAVKVLLSVDVTVPGGSAKVLT